MLRNLRNRITAIGPLGAWLGLMGLLLLGGLIAGLMVFWKGLVITNMTDLVPWGLWITLDLSSISLSAGAFSLCAGVYLFGLKRFQPIARTATFVGLIGYTMAMLALVLDIGRPDRFWHALVYWNSHSLLWEVTMCVVLYLTVLVMESMPIFASLEWLRKHFPRLAEKMEHVHHYAPVLAIIGLGLSSLHQSSLGATYGVIKARPFWFKPEMSVLFMFSALVGGISLTLFLSMISARLTPRAKVNDGLIERVANFVGYLLIGYFYFRAWDALSVTYTYDPGRNEGLQLMTKGPLSFQLLGRGNVSGHPPADGPAAVEPDTHPSLLAHAGAGTRRNGCGGIPLGYQSLRLPGADAIHPECGHRVHSLHASAGRMDGGAGDPSLRDDRLHAGRALPARGGSPHDR